MKLVSFHVERCQLRIRDLLPLRVLSAIQFAADTKSLVCCGACDQTHDHSETRERLPPPVLADVREHPVLDLVPLARSGREVADRYRQSGVVRKFLELNFPESVS